MENDVIDAKPDHDEKAQRLEEINGNAHPAENPGGGGHRSGDRKRTEKETPTENRRQHEQHKRKRDRKKPARLRGEAVEHLRQPVFGIDEQFTFDRKALSVECRHGEIIRTSDGKRHPRRKIGGGEEFAVRLGDFRFERFERNRTDQSFDRAAAYFEADLLIIDDLGSEFSNQFTVATLYNLLNTRLNHRKATLLNTNLSAKELMQSYDRRITSRILGEFTLLTLEGKDIRMQKLGL